MTPATVTKLNDAADAMNLAWPAWRAVAAGWDILSTGIDTGTGALRVAADLDDLVLRTGRLAYTRPDWTLGGATTSPARAAAELTPTTGAATAVLAAIHHGVDAIGRIGAIDQHAVQAFVASLQIYMPTRLLRERYDIPCPYTRAPRSRTQALLAAYATAKSSQSSRAWTPACFKSSGHRLSLAARLARRRDGARSNTRRGLGCSHAGGSACVLAHHISRSVAAWLP
jgi:hypothetical protein